MSTTEINSDKKEIIGCRKGEEIYLTKIRLNLRFFIMNRPYKKPLLLGDTERLIKTQTHSNTDTHVYTL